MNKEKQDTHHTAIEDSFAVYNPDNLPFETLHLCKYLLELPDLQEENLKTD